MNLSLEEQTPGGQACRRGSGALQEGLPKSTVQETAQGEVPWIQQPKTAWGSNHLSSFIMGM